MANVTTSLTPIPTDGLKDLGEKNRANSADKTLTVKTVCEGKFRSLNFARDLSPFVIDEPPGLLGGNTAPNPSEIVLGAFGSRAYVHGSAPDRKLREAYFIAIVTPALKHLKKLLSSLPEPALASSL